MGDRDNLDAWLAGLVGGEAGVAIVAVGSHGRGDRAPFSDLDLVLVHNGRRDIATVADAIWYPIWDRGITLDHSVRTVKEALSVASDDLKAALGLLDGRFVAGDERLATELLDRARDHWRKRSRRFLPELHEAVLARHERAGEVAFLLEPDIKEGRGGLRDVHVLNALALGSPVVDDDARAAIAEPHHLLSVVRVELHARAGKAQDRLLLQEQDAVAGSLGFGDADDLMASIAAAARSIAFANDDAWRRVNSWLAGPGRRTAGRDQQLARGVLLRDGEVVIVDPDEWLRAAAEAASIGAPLNTQSLVTAAANASEPPSPWPAPLRHSLVALLGSGQPAIALLEALDQHGLLVALLPEWANVRHKPQRNAYHRFTVDRHLCEAAVQAARFTRSVSRPDLLLIGALLHDIGKGFPGDHTVVGMEVVGRIGARLGLPTDDVDILVNLVRNHLLLADVATRRDLDDPATIEGVADAVGSVESLELLAALTEADSIATGTSAWSEWKAGLVRDLVARTRTRIVTGARAADPPQPPAAPGLAKGLHPSVDGRSCTVVAPDRPGLFSLVAGVLAANGLDVLSATATTDADGRAVETFEVESASGREPSWDRVRADLDAALEGKLSVQARLAERASAYASRYRARAATPAEPRVLIDTSASERATVVEVRAPDGVGVLYRVTRALAACHLDVRWARVSTLGHEVVDAFYVVGPDGSKVTDSGSLDELERTVLDAIG